MSIIEISRGDSPIVMGLPHTGTFVPPEILDCFNMIGRALADTDWHIDRLYNDLIPGLTSVRTTVHRYVIDVNRDPEGQSLYPGQNTTNLCPLTGFDGNPIYKPGQEPDTDEIRHRLAAFHRPYHTALEAELHRIQALHGYAILYDCHSIRSQIPFLFEGTLPDFSIGTNSGKSCHNDIAAITEKTCRAATGYSTVVNGRFKGGWTTRQYGNPAGGQHAIQMELAQSTYMRERAPWTWNDAKAEELRGRLREILDRLSHWRPQ